LYFYVFNQPFRPKLFGVSSITELIASKPNLYRTISNDGRAFIRSNRKSNDEQKSSSDQLYKHRIPKWSINESNKVEIYGKIQMIFKVYKENKYIRSINLSQTILNENNKYFVTFGRDNTTDFCIQHPSISRKHSVFQFSNDSTLFIYDISTHGTFLNQKQIPLKKYVELKHGDKIKFGHSSRTYVLSIQRGKIGNTSNRKQNAEQTVSGQFGIANDVKMDEMQKTIDKLTKDLNLAQKEVAAKSKQVISLMERMECLNVTNSNRKKREMQNVRIEEEKKRKREKENVQERKDEERISTIKGIDFLKEFNNLSKLTVVKLRYYTDKNNVDVGKVKKAELVKIIQKDIRNHFDL